MVSLPIDIAGFRRLGSKGLALLFLGVTLGIFSGCSSGPSRTIVSAPSPSLKAAEARATTGKNEDIKPTKWNTRAADEIAPGFHIELKGADDPKINGVFTVGPDGALRLPYDVLLQTTGLTLGELRSEVNQAYARYLTSPNIKISIAKKEYYVDVRGLVTKPGQYLVKGDSSLDYIISQAGGLLPGQDANVAAQFVRIDQLGVTNIIRLRDYFSGSQELVPAWQGGESIFFQSERGDRASAPQSGRNYVQLLGQVKQPGEYPFLSGADFYEYLIRAGGPTERADLENLVLVRSGPTARETIAFELEDSHLLPPLKAGDTVIVHADNPSSLEKKSRVIGGFAGIISTLATIILLFATV